MEHSRPARIPAIVFYSFLQLNFLQRHLYNMKAHVCVHMYVDYQSRFNLTTPFLEMRTSINPGGAKLCIFVEVK